LQQLERSKGEMVVVGKRRHAPDRELEPRRGVVLREGGEAARRLARECTPHLADVDDVAVRELLAEGDLLAARGLEDALEGRDRDARVGREHVAEREIVAAGHRPADAAVLGGDSPHGWALSARRPRSDGVQVHHHRAVGGLALGRHE
jgi:hypothetical protein